MVGDEGLLERDAELACVRAALDDARAGGGRLLVIAGEPGIGKTALLDCARRAAREAGMGVLQARGSELERSYPFGVVRQLFEVALRRAGGGRHRRMLEDAGAAAAVLAPPASAGQEVAGSEFAILHGLWSLVADLAGERPLLIAIDDVHWADQPSLRFVQFLQPRLAALPALVLLGTRSSELEAAGFLFASASDAGFSALEPAPLSPAACAALIARRLGNPGGEVFCQACHRASGGNPFYAVERDAVAALARDLADQAILARDGALRFTHPIVRNAVYGDIGAPERDRLHRRAARLLQGASAPAEQIAAQLLACEPAGDRQAVAALEEAAGEALARGAPEPAAVYLRRALAEAVGSGPQSGAAEAERCRLLAKLGAAELRTDGAAAIEHLREAHARAGEPRQRARLAGPLVRALFLTRRWPEAFAAATTALAEADGLDEQGRRELQAIALECAVLDARAAPGREAMLKRIGRVRDDGGVGARLLLDGARRATAPAAEINRRAQEALAGGVLLERDGTGIGFVSAVVALDPGAEVPHQTCWLPYLDARSQLSALRGAPEASLQAALEAARRCEEIGVCNPAYARWRSRAAIALTALGEQRERALELAAEEVELARRWGAPRALGRALAAQASVLSGAEGEDTLREAAAVLEGSPARLEHARVLCSLGAGLRRSGRRRETRPPLRRALELARACGATALADAPTRSCARPAPRCPS
jgi:hypothetical protein